MGCTFFKGGVQKIHGKGRISHAPSSTWGKLETKGITEEAAWRSCGKLNSVNVCKKAR